MNRFEALREEYRAMRDLINQAIEDWPEFDSDDDVSSADLVEWFGTWREQAKALMQPIANEANK